METQAQALTVFSRQYYIQKKFQSRMIFKFCMLTFMGTALFCAIFYTSLNRDIGRSYVQALDGMRFLNNGMVGNFMLSEAAVIFLMGIVVVIFTMLMSHRIAGPLWRIEHTAQLVGDGDLSQEIKLRENDEVKTLADQMNKMIRGLKGRVGDISAAHVQLEMEIARLRQLSETGGHSSEESLAIARQILDTSKTLLGRLNEIKTH